MTAGEAGLARGGLDDLRHGVVAATGFLLGPGKHGIGFEQVQATPGGRGLAADFDGLGKPDRPGHQRGEGQAHHHRLHHQVGIHEHAPGRQVTRQQRDIGGGQRRTREGGHDGRAAPTDHSIQHCSLHDRLPD
jgi:hypothetical protein